MKISHFVPRKSDVTGLTSRERWFSGIFAVTSFGMWLFLLFALMGVSISTYFVILLGVFGLLWVVFLDLTLIFFRPRTAYIVYTLLALFMFAAFGFRDLNFLGIFGFSGGLWLAYRRAQSEKRLLLEFRAGRIARRSLPVFFAGLSLFLAFTYNNFILDDFGDEPRISHTVFDVIYAPAGWLLQLAIPGFDSDTTIQELQGTFLENVLPNILPESIADTGNNRLFSAQFTDPEISAQTPKEFIFGWLNDNVANIIAPYRGLLPIFFVVGLFFAFQFLFFIFMRPIIIIALLVIKLLLLYNIVSVQKINTVKEEMFFR